MPLFGQNGAKKLKLPKLEKNGFAVYLFRKIDKQTVYKFVSLGFMAYQPLKVI